LSTNLNSIFMKKIAQFILICLLAIIVGCNKPVPKIVSEEYPNLKFGFTTQNFNSVIPVTVENVKKLISYARNHGYSWIELRDSEAILSFEECIEIASFARKNSIEINYSVQVGLLDDDFWDIFYKALTNTTVFEGPGYFRTLALLGEGEFGWTEREFHKLISFSQNAAIKAVIKGVGFTVENANTDIDGDGKPYYGLNEFFEHTDPIVKLQLDVANFFTGPVSVTPDQVKSFIKANARRISYLHLKSSREGKPLQVLDGNPLDFKTIFSIIHDYGIEYVAIELVPDQDEQQIYKNMALSIDYLIKEGLVSIK
jgi:sugar phosphate isomerase/epimerase